MNTKRVNPHRQQQFYHLNTAKVRRTQTKQRPIIRNKPITNHDELTVNKYDLNVYKEMVKEVSAEIERMEKKEKEFVIMFIEHSLGRSLSEKEKQKLMVLI